MTDSPPGIEGPVSLVFTDVEGSTALWDAVPNAMRLALQLHDALLRDLIEAHRGYEVKTEGDAFMVAFHQAQDALSWALDVQRTLPLVQWPEPLLSRPEAVEQQRWAGLRVRIGIHVGQANAEPNPITRRMDYFGPTVNLAARVAGSAHGRQIVLSGEAWGACDLPENAVHRPLGKHLLKGLREAVALHEVLPVALQTLTFPTPAGNEIRIDNPGIGGSIEGMVVQLAESLCARAEARRVRGMPEAAQEDLGHAKQLLELVNRPEIDARVLRVLASLATEQGRLEEALTLLDQAARRAEVADARWSQGAILGDRGIVSIRRGALEEARAQLEQAIAVHREVGNTRLEGRDQMYLGVVARRLGHLEEAEECYARALELLQAAGARYFTAAATLNRAVLAEYVEDPNQETQLRTALERCRAVQFTSGEAMALYNLCTVCLAEGRLDELTEMLEDGQALATRLQSPSLLLRFELQGTLRDVLRGHVDGVRDRLRIIAERLEEIEEVEASTETRAWWGAVRVLLGDAGGLEAITEADAARAELGMETDLLGTDGFEALARGDREGVQRALSLEPRSKNARVALRILARVSG